MTTTITPPIIPPVQPVKRAIIVERYGVKFCRLCSFPEAACACDRVPAPDAPPTDGDQSSLNARVRQSKGNR